MRMLLSKLINVCEGKGGYCLILIALVHVSYAETCVVNSIFTAIIKFMEKMHICSTNGQGR